MPYYRREPKAPVGCFLLVWAMSLIICLAFWALVAYGLWEGIQYLQRH